MSITQLPFIRGMARASIGGRIVVRAIDVSRAERPGEDENLLSAIRQIFKANNPQAIVSIPKGSGLPPGHYIFESSLGELESYHHDPKIEQSAKEKLSLGRGHGAGLKKGRNSAHISFAVTVDDEVIDVSGTVEQVANYFQTVMQDNSKLTAKNDRLAQLLASAHKDISFLMNNGPQPEREPAKSNVVPFKPKDATPKFDKPRYRSVNGVLEPVNEIWRPVPGINNAEVSNYGRFRNSNGALHRVYFNNNTPCAMFIRRNKTISVNAALAVALCFCGPRGDVIRFKDGNRKNVHATNLMWIPDTLPRLKSDYRPRPKTLGVAA